MTSASEEMSGEILLSELLVQIRPRRSVDGLVLRCGWGRAVAGGAVTLQVPITDAVLLVLRPK